MRNFMSCTEWVIATVVIALLSIMFLAVHIEQTVEMPKAYQAWCKQTGNPKELTFEEWKSLVSASHKSDTTFIFIPTN